MRLVDLLYLTFFGVALLVIAAKSIVIIKPDERAVVFRLDKFLNVRSAGLLVIVPFVDKVVKVRTDQVAGSDRMSEEELLEQIANIYNRTEHDTN